LTEEIARLEQSNNILQAQCCEYEQNLESERHNLSRTQKALAQATTKQLQLEKKLQEVERTSSDATEALRSLQEQSDHLVRENGYLKLQLEEKCAAYKKELEAERLHLREKYREKFEKGNIEYRALKKSYEDRYALMGDGRVSHTLFSETMIATMGRELDALRQFGAQSASERQKLKSTCEAHSAAAERERQTRIQLEQEVS
jgi:hypothetical protein